MHVYLNGVDLGVAASDIPKVGIQRIEEICFMRNVGKSFGRMVAIIVLFMC